METDDLTLEEKCENLMHIVVESRKRFGKMSVDYDQKISLMENKLLNLQLETISNYRIKSKNLLLHIEDADFKDSEDFTLEVVERRDKIENLIKTIKDTEIVVTQLLGDNVVKKVHQPLTAETMLKLAKEKRFPKQTNITTSII